MVRGRLGRHAEVDECVRAWLETTPSRETVASAVVCGSRAAIQLTNAARYAEADAILARIDTSLPLRATDRFGAAQLARARAMRAMHAGDAEQYLSLSEQAAALFTALGDARNAAIQQASVGHATYELGLYERAEHALLSALSNADRIGIRNLSGYAWLNLGHVLTQLGRIDAARSAEERAAAVGSFEGEPRLLGSAAIRLSDLALRVNDYRAAEAHALRALTILENVPPLRAAALVARALASKGLRKLRDAHDAAVTAVETMQRIERIEVYDAWARTRCAEVLNATGETDLARALVAAAHAALLERAARIADPTVRDRFLSLVPDHVRLRQLASAWSLNGNARS
jgi:tetratricopeptide (TPR) repeat protein